jgi:very-short-patch-repair endonuclease
MKSKSTAPSWLKEIRALPKSERQKVWGPIDLVKENNNTLWNSEQKKKTDKRQEKLTKRRQNVHGRLKVSTNPYLLAFAAKSKRTPAELCMEEILLTHFPGFRPQIVVGRFIADFLNEQRRLIIEVDGEIHFFKGKQDAIRSRELTKMGFKVVRFTNHEVLEQPAEVIAQITALRGAEYALTASL